MFQTPVRPSNESIIWRYIGLDKFIDILLTGTIKFTLASIATDKNEINWILKNLEESKEFETHAESASLHIKNLRNSTYISCWTMKENESRSLWATYLDSTKQGVAIKSNVGNFIKAVEWNKFSFSYSIVDYRNEFHFEELQNNLVIINTKNKAYEEEAEVRFFITGLDEIITQFDKPEIKHRILMDYLNGTESHKKIISLKIDLDLLISELMISPYSSDWQKKNIIQLIKDYKPELLDRLSNSSVNE
jgi:hypothetical protein